MAKKKDGETETLQTAEKLRLPFFLLIFTTVTLIVVMITAYLLSGSSPKAPNVGQEEVVSWLESLPSTTWVNDATTKDERLMEFGYQKVTTLRFSARDQSKDYLRCYLDTKGNTLLGRVRQKEKYLELTVEGCQLELWYTENAKGKFRTLTVKGEEGWLYFVLEE